MINKLQEAKNKAIKTINEAKKSRKTTKRIYALFSGGHDSLVATHLTSQHPDFSGVIHLDTGIGIPETQEYVKETCARFNLHLTIAKALECERADGTPDPQIYEEWVKAYGFPGPAQHSAMYRRLKERPLETALRKIKKTIPDWNSRADQIILTTGIRLEESQRRANNPRYQADTYASGAQLWVCPIRDWTKDLCEEYMKWQSLPRNPVKDNLCMSGECLCGSFAKANELAQIDFFYPEVGDRIHKLEKEVQSTHPWSWEGRPEKSKKQPKKQENSQLQHLCWTCNNIQLSLDLALQEESLD